MHRPRAATPAAAREGLIQDDELLRLERYRAPGGSAPGRFLAVVAANLERGTPYRFLLPQAEHWSEIIEDFRQLPSAQIGGDRVRASCSFRTTAAPIPSGILLYQLDVIRHSVGRHTNRQSGQPRSGGTAGNLSEGMLCSLAELGWDPSVTDWVALLDPSANLYAGQPLENRYNDWRVIALPIDVYGAKRLAGL